VRKNIINKIKESKKIQVNEYIKSIFFINSILGNSNRRYTDYNMYSGYQNMVKYYNYLIYLEENLLINNILTTSMMLILILKPILNQIISFLMILTISPLKEIPIIIITIIKGYEQTLLTSQVIINWFQIQIIKKLIKKTNQVNDNNNFLL